MRPRRLEIEGFSTFRDRVCLDFDGLDLVAFTGATGAGKSTLIDAITFALYGSVARYENTGRVAPVIHQLSNQAKVRLDFESGGDTYIATRIVRRRASKTGDSDLATTREARLELINPANPKADTTVLAGDVKELNAAVEQLLGLDFRQFTRTIVLPQGDFAAFLRDDPASRDKLLQRLLDLGIYERMGQLARSQAKKAGYQAEVLVDQQQQNPPLDDEQFGALVSRAAALERIKRVVADALESLSDLEMRLEPLREQVRSVDHAIDRLEPIAPPDELAGLDGELRNATVRRTEAEAALEAARITRDDALAKLDALPDKGELARVQALGEQLAESTEKVKHTSDLNAQAIEDQARLTAEQREVDDALAEAEVALRAARLAADASGWTAALVTGEPCPVCHREVETIPDHDAAHEMEQAGELHRKLESQSKSIAKQLAKAAGTALASAEEIERSKEHLDLLQLQLSTYDGSTEPAVLNQQLEAVEAADRGYRETVAATTELEATLSAATADENQTRVLMQSMQAQLSALRDSVADLEPPPLGHESLVEDYDAIQRWAKDRAAELSVQRQQIADEGKSLAKQRAELIDQLSAATNAVGIDCDPASLTSLTSLTSEVADALAQSKASVVDADRRRDEYRRTESRIAELQADRLLNDGLGKHLRAGGFGSWLLGEAIDNIVAKATVWMLQLSNNQYSLIAGDKNFAIIDHNNADEKRDVRTLSGGETFLASLALALALADSIAELAPVDAPRLESMFLDEGFGTLDPGTLDVVAGAIEELASSGRMIGIVTHVNDLAERMPARFEVTKGPATSTVELVEL